MLNIFKQFKKQPDQLNKVTKFLIKSVSDEMSGRRTLEGYKHPNKISLHTLRFFINLEFNDITAATFNYCIQQAMHYYNRDYNVGKDKNNIYLVIKL